MALRNNRIDQIKKRVAQAAISPSAVRNQGAKGVVAAARDSLELVNLSEINVCGGGLFRAALDRETEKIKAKFPVNAQNWGAARKVLNLYLRDVVGHRDISDWFDLYHIKKWLEVPLDTDVVKKLKAQPEGVALPKWTGISRVTSQESAQYQSVASMVATRLRVDRVDLDAYFWRS